MTDETGVFHAFMPLTTTGQWWVSYVAISCESNIMSSDCSSWIGEPHPKGTYIQLPGQAGSTLEFVWE